MRVIYRKIRHARYLYIKRNVEKVWGARYTLGARVIYRKIRYNINYHHVDNNEAVLLVLLLNYLNMCKITQGIKCKIAS